MLGICLNDGLHEGARERREGEQLKAGKIAFHLVTSRAITWPVAIARPSMSSPLLLLLLLLLLPSLIYFLRLSLII